MDVALAHEGETLESIYWLYRAAVDGTRSRDPLRLLSFETSSTLALWACFDGHARSGEIVESYNAPPEFVRLYNDGFGGRNIWLKSAGHFKSEGAVWPGSSIIPEADLIRSDFYEHMLAPWDIHHTLHLVIALKGDVVVHVLLARHFSSPDYGASEIAVARSFARHARNALDIQEGFVQAQSIRTVLSDLANAAGQPFAILDGSQLIHTSASFTDLFSAPGTDLVAFPQNRQPGRPLHLPREIANAVAVHDGLAPTTIVTKLAKGKRLIARLKPFSFRDPIRSQPRLMLAIVIHDPNQRSSIDEKLLQSAYELTKAEARICSLLVDGHSVDRISAELNISPNTVRSHLQKIFQKTETVRQLDLVKLLLNVASSHVHAASAAIGVQPSVPTLSSIHNQGQTKEVNRLRTSQFRGSPIMTMPIALRLQNPSLQSQSLALSAVKLRSDVKKV